MLSKPNEMSSDSYMTHKISALLKFIDFKVEKSRSCPMESNALLISSKITAVNCLLSIDWRVLSVVYNTEDSVEWKLLHLL